MKNKQKAAVVNPTTNPVPLAKLSEEDLDMVSGGYSKFVFNGSGYCKYCNNDNGDA